MRFFIPIFFVLVVTIVSTMGFRGDFTENTPLEVFPDMDRQAKFKSQTQNNFFGDKKADRLPVPGTAIRGTAVELSNVFSEKPFFHNLAFRTGKKEDGSWVQRIPDEASIDMSLMRLGKERYGIHCAVCHGEYGNGQGVISQFGLAPRNLSDSSNSGAYLESAAPWSDGQIFHAISMGSASGIMLGLKDKLSPKERWAIVLYVRALQSYVSNATDQTLSASK